MKIFRMAVLVLTQSITMTGLAADARLSIPELPVAISNNAVAGIEVGKHFQLYSFYGLESGKSWRDVSRKALEYDSRTGKWNALSDVPVSQGRLASLAVSSGKKIYLFGGYTVSEKGDEVSTSEVFRFDPLTRKYKVLTPMPVPVDDSAAIVYRDRYIILVTGWHEKDNVGLVQIYDRIHNRWTRGTDWPGAPVFGHVAAIDGNAFLVCDGVRLDVKADGKRVFSVSKECWRADIQAKRPENLVWTEMPPHPGPPRYRMGANALGHHAYFAGGSTTPYNFNGMGYDGVAATPSNDINVFDFKTNQWQSNQKLAKPSMDHRGFPCIANTCFLIGGMSENQGVRNSITAQKLE